MLIVPPEYIIHSAPYGRLSIKPYISVETGWDIVFEICKLNNITSEDFCKITDTSIYKHYITVDEEKFYTLSKKG
jgi:hypothetical protein